MKFLPLMLTVILFVSLSGCVNMHQERMALLQQQIEESKKNDGFLCNAKRKETAPYITSLRGKIDSKFDETYPVDFDKKSLLKYKEARDYCFNLGFAGLKKFFSDEHVTTATIFRSLFDDNFHALYAGKITYGNFAQQEDRLQANFSQRMAEIDAKQQEISMQQQMYNQQMQMQHLEMARRLLTPPQHNHYQPVAPTQTRCVNYGYAVNCTQY